MRSEVVIESESSEDLMKILERSLESSERISQSVSAGENDLRVKIETESLGQLRGCTDTVFRLGSLAKKIVER